MKQNLRLGDSYALLATNYTKLKRKLLTRRPPVAQGQRRVSLGYASGMPAVYLRYPWISESYRCPSCALRIPLILSSRSAYYPLRPDTDIPIRLQPQTTSGRNPFRTRLGLASELEATSVQTRCRLVAPDLQQASVQSGSNLPQRWSNLPRHIQDCSKAGWNVRATGRAAKRNPEEPCVCTHAKVPAHRGLGLALGMAVLLFIALGKQGFAQERFSVNGKVISAASGVAIEGATVTNKRTRVHAITDRVGEYRIPARPDDVLSFSYVGYATAEEHINGREQIIVALDSAESMLEEVEINAGYYTVKDRERTGSISRITAAEIGKQPVSNILSALRGRVPGVYIQQESGVPGSAMQVKVRGQNSLRNTYQDNGNLPLYLIDGVPFPMEPLASSNGASIVNGGNPLHNINPADIESVTILKDADATAIYGSRGANGVVLITTKRGKKGDTSIDINLSHGVSAVANRMPLLNTDQYLAMRYEALSNDGAVPGTLYPDHDLLVWDTTRYTDWQDELIGGNAQMTTARWPISFTSSRLLSSETASYFVLSEN